MVLHRAVSYCGSGKRQNIINYLIVKDNLVVGWWPKTIFLLGNEQISDCQRGNYNNINQINRLSFQNKRRLI